MTYPIAYPIAWSRLANTTPVLNPFKTGGLYSAEQSLYMRMSREGLARMREHQLSPRDLSIIASINECKLLTASQIQRLHFPLTQHASFVTAYRMTNRVLLRLTQKKILAKVERKVGGLYGGSGTNVYGLGVIGARLVGKRNLFYYSEQISTLFLEHTIAINEIYVSLIEANANNQIKLVNLQTETQCWRPFLYGYGIKEILKPDLYVRMHTIDGQTEYNWFIEVDRDTIHTPSIVKKAQIYQKYYQSGDEQTKKGIFPQVLWLVPDEVRLERLVKAFYRMGNKVSSLHVVELYEDALQIITGQKPP